MICYLLFTLAILVVAVLVIKFIVITSTGAIIIHCIILVINNALYGVPYSIEIHSVFKIKLNINCFIATAISILEKDVCILCKKSAKAPTIPALIGPNLIAAITNGIKANPILMFHADIETNRDKTISKEINNPIITKGLVFVSRFSLFLVYIKTLLCYNRFMVITVESTTMYHICCLSHNKKVIGLATLLLDLASANETVSHPLVVAFD